MMLIELLDRDLLEIIAQNHRLERKRNHFFENPVHRARTRCDDTASGRNQQAQKASRVQKKGIVGIALTLHSGRYTFILVAYMMQFNNFSISFAAQFIFIHLCLVFLRLIHNLIYFIPFLSEELRTVVNAATVKLHDEGIVCEF